MEFETLFGRKTVFGLADSLEDSAQEGQLTNDEELVLVVAGFSPIIAGILAMLYHSLFQNEEPSSER